MDKFNVLQNQLIDLSRDERRDLILQKICEYNSAKDPTNVSVLLGTVIEVSTENNYSVGDIYTIFGSSLSRNPYTRGELIIIVNSARGTKNIEVGERVVFTVNNEANISPSGLLRGNSIQSFSGLGLGNDASVSDCVNCIKKIKPFSVRLRDVDEVLKKINTEDETTTVDNTENNEIDTVVTGEHPDLAVAEYESTDETTLAMLPQQREKIIDEFMSRLDYDNYDRDAVTSFLMSMCTSQIVILFGAPGTGKTTFVKKMAKAIGAECSIISVQNNWTDSSDIMGYYSPINRTFESTPFIEALLTAKQEWDEFGKDAKLHIICLDEMNLARVEYYFAFFLSMLQLDASEQKISLLPKYIQSELLTIEDLPEDSSERKHLERLRAYADFLFPQNVRFVGTMNNDDTTTVLSPKVIDRSFFIEVKTINYAEDKNFQNLQGYYPQSFFNSPKEMNAKMQEMFSRQNNRFKHYVSQMAGMYQILVGGDISEESNYRSFIENVITGKILPALKTAVFEFDRALFPKAAAAFDQRNQRTQFRDNTYNYLGGL